MKKIKLFILAVLAALPMQAQAIDAPTYGAAVGASQVWDGLNTTPAAGLTSATSILNSSPWLKYIGRIIVNTGDNAVYMATGTSPTSVWKNLSGGADITPA